MAKYQYVANKRALDYTEAILVAPDVLLEKGGEPKEVAAHVVRHLEEDYELVEVNKTSSN